MLISSIGRPSVRAGVLRRGAVSTAFGSTVTCVRRGSRAASWVAAARLTAVHTAGAPRNPAAAIPRAGTGPIPFHMECTVTTVGTPLRAANAARGAEKGATTETWAWTTSKCPKSKPDASRKDRARITGTGSVDR